MEPTTNLLLVIGKTSGRHDTEGGEGLATEKMMKIPEELYEPADRVIRSAVHIKCVSVSLYSGRVFRHE
jgi:hypothetical protein